MTETRVKVYRVDTDEQRSAFQRDQAEARAHGWLLAGRAFRPDGSLEATYQHGTPASDEWATTPAGPAPLQQGPVPVYIRDPPVVSAVRLILGVIAVAILWRLLGSPNHTDIIDYVQDVATYIQTGQWPS